MSLTFFNTHILAYFYDQKGWDHTNLKYFVILPTIVPGNSLCMKYISHLHNIQFFEKLHFSISHPYVFSAIFFGLWKSLLFFFIFCSDSLLDYQTPSPLLEMVWTLLFLILILGIKVESSGWRCWGLRIWTKVEAWKLLLISLSSSLWLSKAAKFILFHFCF